MALDLEQIRKNYADFEDFKIEYLAKNEINSLDPEVVLILKEEIKKRRLDTNLNKGIEAQTKKLTDEELIDLKSKISKLTCPECGQKNPPLIGTLLRVVKSFIFLTFYIKTPIISCKDCADKKRKQALITTALLGWWGIPVGLFRTPQVIITTLTDSKKRETQSNAILTNFVIKHVGEIRTNWDKESELVDFVHHINKTN
jgi:hypothetical protein